MKNTVDDPIQNTTSETGSKNKQKQATENGSIGCHTMNTKEVNEKINDACMLLEEYYSYIEVFGKLPLDELHKTIIPCIKDASKIPHIYHLFYGHHSTAKYTFRHSICVSIIANLIGGWLNLAPSELDELTLGALLCDIGKIKIPSEILNKPAALSSEEYKEMRLHTVYGYEILRDLDGISDRVARIALQHHEREDGRGYPYGTLGGAISYYSKIVAIADVFHAMSSARVYQDASPFYSIMKQMQRDAYGKLNPTIVLTFLNKMMNSLIGRKVRLTDGHEGTIIMIDPYDPIRCLLLSGDEHIDLRYNREVQIQKIIED